MPRPFISQLRSKRGLQSYIIRLVTRRSSRVAAIDIAVVIRSLINQYRQMGIKYALYIKKSKFGSLGWSRATMGGIAGSVGCLGMTDAFFLADVPIPVDFRIHVHSQGWLDWVPQGHKCSSNGQRLEAIQFRFPNGVPDDAVLMGRAHLENIGWTKTEIIPNNGMLGTTQQSRRLEAIQLVFASGSVFANKPRLAHIQDTLVTLDQQQISGTLTQESAIQQLSNVDTNISDDCKRALVGLGMATAGCAASIYGAPVLTAIFCGAIDFSAYDVIKQCQLEEKLRNLLQQPEGNAESKGDPDLKFEDWRTIDGVDYTAPNGTLIC